MPDLVAKTGFPTTCTCARIRKVGPKKAVGL